VASSPSRSIPLAARARALRELDRRVVEDVAAYAHKRFGSEWEPGRVEPRSAASASGMTLYLYDYVVRGRPILSWYLGERGAALGPAERAWVVAQQRAWSSIWEIDKVRSKVGVALHDLLTGEERFVHEADEGFDGEEGDALLARIVDHEGCSVFSGLFPQPFPCREAARVAGAMRAHLGSPHGLVATDRMREPTSAFALLGLWAQHLDDLSKRPPPPVVANNDGEPLLMTVDHYAFDPSRTDDVLAVLLRFREAEETGEDGPARGDTHQIWFGKRTSVLDTGWSRTLLAEALLSPGKLRIETNSVVRGDAMRKRVEKACGKLVRHVARAHRDADAYLARARREGSPRKAPRTPAEAARRARVAKERTAAAMLDEPIGALGGFTPREAAARPRWHAMLEMLFLAFEELEAAAPSATRFDVGRLRRKLRFVAPR
jgi:hypothetical protein